MVKIYSFEVIFICYVQIVNISTYCWVFLKRETIHIFTETETLVNLILERNTKVV